MIGVGVEAKGLIGGDLDCGKQGVGAVDVVYYAGTAVVRSVGGKVVMAMIGGISETELMKLRTEMGVGSLFVKVTHNDQTVAFSV